MSFILLVLIVLIILLKLILLLCAVNSLSFVVTHYCGLRNVNVDT